MSFIYTLGQIFRLVADIARPNGANNADMTMAEIFPYKGITTLIPIAMSQHIPNKTNKIIAKLMNSLDVDKLGELFNTPTPMNIRMQWYMGYMDAPNLLKNSKLKEKRIKCGLSQNELADRIGCLQKDISRWENEIVKPSIDNAKLLAEALGCTVDEII